MRRKVGISDGNNSSLKTLLYICLFYFFIPKSLSTLSLPTPILLAHLTHTVNNLSTSSTSQLPSQLPHLQRRLPRQSWHPFTFQPIRRARRNRCPFTFTFTKLAFADSSSPSSNFDQVQPPPLSMSIAPDAVTDLNTLSLI